MNFNGTVTDPEATARALQRVLMRSDLRNGRIAPEQRSW